MPEPSATDRQSPLRVVPDTNVCLDLFVFDEPACASLLAAVRQGWVELVTRDDCRAEWLAVLGYPRLGLDASRREQAMQAFDAWVRPVSAADATPGNVTLPRCSDPDDQKFLELAWQSRAAALLTRDDALLKLARRTRRAGLFAILLPTAWRDV